MRNFIASRLCSSYGGLRKICCSSTISSHLRRPLPIPAFSKPGRVHPVFDRYLHATSFVEARWGSSAENGTPPAAATPPPRSSNSATLVALGVAIGIGVWYSMRKRMRLLGPKDDSNGKVELVDSWEEVDEPEPEVGGVLQNCSWGERALYIAQEVLQGFVNGMGIKAFKTSPRGHIFVRLSYENECPNMAEIEVFCQRYMEKLNEVGARGGIPEHLALEVVSTPGHLSLRDLLRFKDMPMRLTYVEDPDPKSPEKNGVYMLSSVDTESEGAVWILANVEENRDPLDKGQPKKDKPLILILPFDAIRKITLYYGKQ